VERLGVRELRISTASAVRRAGAGERIVITVDGRPVAQLGPIEGAEAASLEDLAARGLIRLPSRADRPASKLAVAVWPGFRLGRLFRELRG
jgi:prevent-host-death family protein